MPIISEHVHVERKPKLGGGGPGKIPHKRGYGGGDDGDHDRSKDFSSRKERLRRYRIGILLCIISVSTLFICLTLAYVFRQNLGTWDPIHRQWIRDWRALTLPYRQLWINTLILLLSSFTLEMARRKMAHQAEFAALGIVPIKGRAEVPWLGLTVLLGFGFLAGQVVVWNGFRSQGLFLHNNPSSSFFFILTGMHAIHLTGGLLALLYAAGGRLLKLRFDSQILAVDATASYWHFMGGLWLYIFGLLYFLKG